jgi:hypothetical protein
VVFYDTSEGGWSTARVFKSAFFEKLKVIELAFSVRGAFQLYWKIFVLLPMNGSVEDRPFGIKTLF